MAPLHHVTLLLLSVCIMVGSPGGTNIPAEPGQNIILPCNAFKYKAVVIVEWSRTDLGEMEHVALFQDERLDYHGQHPAYKNRVDMEDRELKHGDVSLFLKNVTINDSGTYQCRVDGQKKRRRRAHLDTDPICTINLLVAPPPPGKNEEQKYVREKEEEEKDDGGNKNGTTVGVLVGVIVGVVILGVVVGGLLYKYWRRSDQEQNRPPAEETERELMSP
ncbi:uncharacterized protein LOC118561346 [Fundulus heteroclitus]|uniref:uncharacterized protein LOC118561346 n=1 Tax=Fundulus heteroclitus TaxID=8078 RepID=UPI00165A599D|nr:uncharacterized protein LOC118561346 [Fundulus heteroclitus]